MTGRVLLSLLLISSLTGPVLGLNDLLEIRLRVEPADSTVLVSGYLSSSDSGGPGQHAQGGVLLLPRADLTAGSLTLTFSSPGHESVTRTFVVANAVRNSNSITLPPEGEEPIRLPRLGRTPAQLGAGAAALLGLLILTALGLRRGLLGSPKSSTLSAPGAEQTPSFSGLSGKPLTGQRFGSYQLEEPLGSGGMATVYRAFRCTEDGTIDRTEPLAVKLIQPQASESSEFRDRFRREIAVSSRLHHRNIVRVYDSGMVDGVYFLVLELVQGGDLSSRIGPEPMPLAEAMSFLIPLFEAVGFAHRQGVVHRDIKPENVLLDAQGRPKLADFGIARRDQGTKLTATGHMLGTPAYMSPEQLEGREVTEKTDQYALGVLTYELLTGRLPFEGSDPFVVIAKHLTQEPTPPTSLRADLPDEADRFVLRLLRKDASERFDSVEAALAELRRLGSQ